MNDSKKRIRKGMKYKILPKGWRFIIVSIILSSISFPIFFDGLGSTWKTALDIHWYDKESKKTIEKECTILGIREFYSPINKYQDPVFEVTLQEKGGNTKFKKVLEKSPGTVGNKAMIEIEKGRYLGKRPEYGNAPLGFVILPLLYALGVLFYLLFELMIPYTSYSGPIEGCLKNKETGEVNNDDKPGLLLLLSPCALMFILGVISWALIIVFL